MTDTINNKIPFVPENTIDPAAGLNLSLNTIDALLQVLVQTVGANTPPTGVEGQRFIVGTTPTGAWAGQANKLARFLGGAWQFFDARHVLNAADGLWYVRSSSAWLPISGNVAGPVSAVDGGVALFDGVTGKIIKDGGALGSAAFTPSTAYATSSQGATADSALQPGAIGVTVQGYSANLAAFSGLSGLADQLPYFTGAGALSLATLTAAGRTLIGATSADAQLTALEFTPTGKALAKAADAAAGRTALELGTAAVASMTTSQTDTTPGRVLRVGDFGAGTSIFLTSVDIDTLGAWNSAYYVSSGINTPTSDDGWLTHLGLLPDFTHQTFYASTGDRVYIRRKFNGLWRPWREIYHQGSILGTVSQSGGVPTGELFEYGSNANGEYWRYAGGMQICTNSNNAIATNPATFTGTVTDIDGSKFRVGRWF